MKKALILASVPSMIEQFNMHNIEILQKLGYKVEVAANFKIGGNLDDNRLKEFKKELNEKKIKYIHIPFCRNPFTIENVKAYKATKRLLQENNYDLIHLHSPIGGVCGRLAARKENTKIIYTAHGFHFYKGAPFINWVLYYPIEKYLSKYTDVLITINHEDYERAKRKFKAKRTCLIHGVGVDKNKFDFEMKELEKVEFRNSIGLSEKDFVIISIGELNENKNQIMQIKAMQKLKKEDVKLVLVGKGKNETYLKEKIKKYNLQNNVILLGYRNDVPKLLKVADLAVSTSIREGLGLNIVEAIISGVPFIATNNRRT